MRSHTRHFSGPALLALLGLGACASDEPGEGGDTLARSGGDFRLPASPSLASDAGSVAPNCALQRCTTGLAPAAWSRGADAGARLAPQAEPDDVNAFVASVLEDAGTPRPDENRVGECDGPSLLASELATGAACPKGADDGCGGGQLVGSCAWENRYCHNGVIWQSSSERLDCASAPVASSQAGAAPWADCDAALRAGRTGEACGFVGSCTRATDDPCCVETASCGLLHQEQKLYRYRVCAPGCKSVHANAARAQVTRCTGGDMTSMLGAPCKPGLVCIAGGEPSQTGALSYYVSSLFFCANGVLVGNPNAFLPFL